jgi:uncharacterized protein YneR
MNKIIFILSSLVFIASACGQRSNNQTTIANNENVCEQSIIGKNQGDLFFPLTKEFEWVNFEKQDQELKTRFLKNLPDDFEFYTQYGGMSNLEAGLHVVDFNGDGLNDIIFTGYFGGEAEKILIFIDTGQSFVKIFTETQKFHKVVVENGKVQKMYIQDGGCCCEYLLTNKIFSVDYSSDLPKINLISQMQYLNNSVEEYPNSYFEKPIKFEVLNDKYNIRFSPVIDDTTQVWYCGEPQNGNSLGKIKLGSIGYALAEKVDSTGRIWWFVALHPNSGIYEPIYYDDEIRPNSYKLGWIVSIRYYTKNICESE